MRKINDIPVDAYYLVIIHAAMTKDAGASRGEVVRDPKYSI
jgi:hypothetical protein